MRALVVPQLVREDVGAALLRRDAEGCTFASVVEVRDAAEHLPPADQQGDQIRPVPVALRVNLVQVSVIVCAQTIEIDTKLVVRLPVVDLVAVDQPDARQNQTVGVIAVGIVEEQANERVDVPRQGARGRGVGDQHVNHVATVRGCGRRAGIRRERVVVSGSGSGTALRRVAQLARHGGGRPARHPALRARREPAVVAAIHRGEPAAERTQVVGVTVVGDRADHVLAHDHQRDFRPRRGVPAVHAVVVLRTLRDFQSSERYDLRRPGALQSWQSQRQRPGVSHRVRVGHPDPELGHRGVVAQRIEGRRRKRGESGPRALGSTRDMRDTRQVFDESRRFMRMRRTGRGHGRGEQGHRREGHAAVLHHDVPCTAICGHSLNPGSSRAKPERPRSFAPIAERPEAPPAGASCSTLGAEVPHRSQCDYPERAQRDTRICAPPGPWDALTRLGFCSR